MVREEAVRLTRAVQATYNSIADHFSQSRWKLWEDLYYFSPFLKDGQSILDLGCGNGRVLELLRELNISYVGVDASEKLLEQARGRSDELPFVPQFEQHDLLTLDLGETFDVILLIAVLQHIPRALHDEVMERIVRHLTPDGHLLMTNWNMWQRSYVAHVFLQWWHKLTHPSQRMFDVPYARLGWRDVFIPYQQNADAETLRYRYLYAFTRRELMRLLKRHGFEIQLHIYTDKHARSSWWRGRNILTVARRVRV